MPVGLKEPRDTLPVAGVRLGVAQAGIRYAGRTDLVVMEIAEGASCAAVFTRNAFCAAPVSLARRHLVAAAPRYLVINSGNANAGTGQQGLADALASCRAVAGHGGCGPDRVLPFSTGVIGEPLPVDRLAAGLAEAFADLRRDGWPAASRAIMTTDTLPKLVSRSVELSGGRVTVTGMAKGAGMIRPDMATMLAFLATDARVEREVLQACLGNAVERSFNRITVDGDTSTNDACVLVATGAQASAGVDDALGADYEALCGAVTRVCTDLAQAIVRDGEGATKFITVAVDGGAEASECLAVAYTVAHSPLVKTALFAGDPNWGRILAAVGRAGVPALAIERVGIDLGDVRIVEHGGRASDYTEARGQAVMRQEEITIGVHLGRGDAQATVWTTDLSYDYVKINAEYRT